MRRWGGSPSGEETGKKRRLHRWLDRYGRVAAIVRQGAQLIVSGRREEAGQPLATELRGPGARAEFVRADVRREADVQAMVAAAVSHVGRLGVAVNNAVNNAGTGDDMGPLGRQTIENDHATFDASVPGTLLSLKRELPPMLAQGGGVNIASIAGRIGCAGAAISTASKHAVEGLIKAAVRGRARRYTLST